MVKFFTGVGSRQTPKSYIPIIEDICQYLHTQSFTLRSGGADGADTWFENSYRKLNGNMEIYLPWKKFNNNPSPRHAITNSAMHLASIIHPAWDKCSHGARALHARNCYQVLGYQLNLPSSLVVCYTEDGKCKGGTATCIKLSNILNIPVFNLGSPTVPPTIDDFMLFLERYSLV